MTIAGGRKKDSTCIFQLLPIGQTNLLNISESLYTTESTRKTGL